MTAEAWIVCSVFAHLLTGSGFVGFGYERGDRVSWMWWCLLAWPLMVTVLVGAAIGIALRDAINSRRKS